MLDQMNYQICPYYINKITNEKTNYSLLPYLILKTSKQRNLITLSPFTLLSLSLKTSKHSISLSQGTWMVTFSLKIVHEGVFMYKLRFRFIACLRLVKTQKSISHKFT